MLDKKFRIKFTTNSLDARIPVVATSLRNLIDTLQFSYENKVPARVGRVTKPTEFSTNCMQEILIIDIYCLQDCYEILVKVLETLPLTCFMYKPYIKRNIYRIFVNSEYQLSKHITLVNSFVNLLNKTAIALNLINGIVVVS